MQLFDFELASIYKRIEMHSNVKAQIVLKSKMRVRGAYWKDIELAADQMYFQESDKMKEIATTL